MCSVASKLGSIEEELGMERGREGGLNQEAIRQGSPGQRSLDEHGTNFAHACKWILSCSIYCVYIYILYIIVAHPGMKDLNDCMAVALLETSIRQNPVDQVGR